MARKATAPLTSAQSSAETPKTTKPRAKSAPKASSNTGTGQDNVEAAVLNASDIPPQARTDIDVAAYRDRLLEEMARLEEEREYVRHSGDLDGSFPEDAEGEEDTTDLATSLMDKEMDMNVEEEVEETLAAIEHALQKIEDGTYGICDVSGENIPKARLELIPWASLTAQMQAMAEGEIE